MSREGNNTVAGSASSTATESKDNPSKKDADPKHTEDIEQDDSDFVLVKSRSSKKHAAETHNSRIHYHHKPIRQQSHYNDGGGGGDEDDYVRRRRFRDHHNNNNHQKRDNSTGSKLYKGRMNKRDNKQNNQPASSTANDKENTAVLPVCTEQNNKTGSSLSAVSPTTTHPVVKTFSLVVAAGSSSGASLNNSKSGIQQRLPPPESWVPILQQPKPTLCPLPSQPLLNNSRSDNNVDPLSSQLPNAKEENATRAALLVEVEGASASSSSVVTERSSSIPDTSSLTSEETIDSCSGMLKSSTEQVEFVEAPIPKVNPWLANRNAAQMIVGPAAAPNTSRTKVPGVDESFPDIALAPRKSQTSKVSQQSHPPAAPTNSNSTKPTGNQGENAKIKSKPNPSTAQVPPQVKTNIANNASIPGQPKPPSFAQAISASPATKITQTQPTELRNSTSDTLLLHSLDNQNLSQPVYVRETSNGFRPGRGRGSYSASAAAGRKIPSRTQVLMKVVSNDDRSLQTTCDDWPTLGEAISKVPPQQQPTLPKLKADGNEETSEVPEVEEKMKTLVVSTDAVDGNNVDQSLKEDVPDSAVPPASTASNNVQQPSSSPRTSSRSSNEDQCSDNDYDDTLHKNGSGTPTGKKGNKQKWVPLALDLPSAGTPEGRGTGKYSTGGGGKGGRGGKYGSYSSPGPHHHQNSQYNSGQNYYQQHHGGFSGGGGGGRGKWKSYMNYDDLDMDRHSRNYSQPPPRGMRGGFRNSSRSHHSNSYYRKQNGGPPPRNGPTTATSNTALMNGHHYQTHHHPSNHAPHLDLLSPTGSTVQGLDGSIFEYTSTTLTPMFPAHTEFIMPYVANGYFQPAPFLSPTSTAVIVADNGTANNGSLITPGENQEPLNKASFEMLTDKVRTQIEYYFSEDNLEKDFYLRRKMDEEGYLPINLLISFPRVKNMTQDYQVILEAIKGTDKLELRKDESSVRTGKDPCKWPIIEPRNTLMAALQHQDSIVPSSSADSYSSSESSSSSSSQSINNNDNQPLLFTSSEMLNPNVPEFVPKSKVM